MKLRNFVLSLFLSMVGASVLAQWQWVDKDGRKVYSDRAPPLDVPEKNIVKRPAGRNPVPTDRSEAVTPESATPVVAPQRPSSAPKTSLDKELEAKKKATADAEVARKKADEDRLATARAESCARAKQAKATMDSGVRIGRVNAAGEREIMDDAARAAETKRIEGVIASDCAQ